MKSQLKNFSFRQYRDKTQTIMYSCNWIYLCVSLETSIKISCSFVYLYWISFSELTFDVHMFPCLSIVGKTVVMSVMYIHPYIFISVLKTTNLHVLTSLWVVNLLSRGNLCIYLECYSLKVGYTRYCIAINWWGIGVRCVSWIRR